MIGNTCTILIQMNANKFSLMDICNKKQLAHAGLPAEKNQVGFG